MSERIDADLISANFLAIKVGSENWVLGKYTVSGQSSRATQ